MSASFQVIVLPGTRFPDEPENLRWGVAQGVSDGSPLIVRYNVSAKEWISHPELSVKLGFAVPLNSPNESGLPDPAENEQLNDIEDVIVREVGRRAIGLHVLVLTTGTMKEVVFQIREDADIKAIHEAIQQSISTHEVQCMAMMEPEWDSYRLFAPN